MNERLNYNFDPAHIADGDFRALYEQRRRDSIFAYVCERDGLLYALRDHLGAVGLFYRRTGDGFRFSTNLTDLVQPGDEADPDALRYLLGLGSPKLAPPVKGIEIVPPGAVLQLNPATGAARVVYRYQLHPARLSPLTSMFMLVETVDRLFTEAIRRGIRADTVGLYLSGGIDSSLIGIYLRRLGVKVNAYTSAPWGATSSELPFAQANAARVGVEQQHVDLLETDKYLDAFSSIPALYGLPHGTSTGIAVASLWKHTPIATEQQIFFGQNSDTMTCSVPAQYLLYFTSFLPAFVRRRFGLPHRDLIHNYIAFSSRHLVRDYPPLYEVGDVTRMNRVQRLTIAGMYAVHSPSDGEVLAQPAIYAGIPVANPYYDMDLVEFCMGIPLRYRLTASREAKFWLMMEKQVFRAWALRYLPPEVVYRKKGFTVSMERDEATRRLVEQLPTSLAGITVKTHESQIAAGVFRGWCAQHGVTV